VAFYDNIKHVPDWLSDEACKAVTGIGHTKRKLYSNDDDVIYEYKRCIGFNGINISLTEPDALDRSILIELNRIPKEKRRLESEILVEFEKIKPKLLAHIFDIVANALSIKPTVRLNDVPRMADFAIWGEAIARAIGYTENEFINTYYDNIGRQNLEAIEAHPLGHAVAKFCEDESNDQGRIEWEGSPSDLSDKLRAVAEQYKININQKLWPHSPSILVRRLNTIRANLLEGLGISVTVYRLTSGNKKNTSMIRIVKMPPLAPPEVIQAQNQDKAVEIF
jgi:hypothetical protein